VKDGKVHRLEPAVWLFASTDRIPALASSPAKGSDFVSRLNGPIVELDTCGNDYLAHAIAEVQTRLRADVNMTPAEYCHAIYGEGGHQPLRGYKEFSDAKDDPLKTDQVYIMVSRLNAHWGPIAQVQRNVLQLFHDLLAVNGVRSMELFASKFVEVERGRVLASNVPRVEHYAELRRHIVVPSNWLTESRPKDDLNDLIEIETLIK
jgi:hypothetical protein